MALAGVSLGACATLGAKFGPAPNAALTSQADAAAPPCGQPVNTPPDYRFEDLQDCTSPDTLIIYAFSGGGIRSAAFGYGVLSATHEAIIPDDKGGHGLDKDIDIVSGVSGGSFTAAAFANERADLFFDDPDAPDTYRNGFLEHNFMGDLLAIYLEPWHWQWMLPNYGTNDEMAKIYGHIPFGESGKLFGENFADLAKKGRPFLVIQATDFSNEQPFTFTQNDFDLICSDLNQYDVKYAVAASNGFPVLFSPIQLTNHHSDTAGYCTGRNPSWVDTVAHETRSEKLSRTFSRAQIAETYLPSPAGEDSGNNSGGDSGGKKSSQSVFLQDGGVTDNVALRGLMNIVAQSLEMDWSSKGWGQEEQSSACKAGLDRVRKILVVSVDGEAQPDNTVSSLPYFSDIGRILDVATSASIDANDFETLLAAESMTNRLAMKLRTLNCSPPGTPATNADGTQRPASHDVAPYFAQISFRDLDATKPLQQSKECIGSGKKLCTVNDLAHSGTSLNFSGDEVKALIAAGKSAFTCNPAIYRFLTDSHAKWDRTAALKCATGLPEGAQDAP